MSRFFGKYRAVVTNVDDPLRLGRVQVATPEFPGMTEAWCLPNTPYAGKDVGFYTIPPVGARVWLEFEGGNLDTPIWAGCFWSEEEVPLGEGITPDKKVLQTANLTMILDDTAEKGGGFTLEVRPDAVETRMRIACDASGMTLTTFGSDDKAVSTVALTTEHVVIDHPRATITLTADTLTLTVPTARTEMTASQVLTSVDAGSTSVTASAVTNAVSATSSKVDATGVTLTSAPSTAQVKAEGVTLQNGANSVAVTPASVALNESALVVI